MNTKQFYKNIIWDWNGTLLDDMQVCSDLVNRGLEKIGKAPVSLQQQREAYTIPITMYYEKLGVSLIEFKEIAKGFLDKHKELLPTIALRSHIAEVLAHAHKSDIKQYILSSHLQDHIEEGIKLKEIEHYFAAVYGLPTGSSGQPKSALGAKLINDHKINVQETVMFGDSVHDYEVALEMGVECILIAGGHQCNKVLRASGARVVERIEEVLQFL